MNLLGRPSVTITLSRRADRAESTKKTRDPGSYRPKRHSIQSQRRTPFEPGARRALLVATRAQILGQQTVELIDFGLMLRRQFLAGLSRLYTRLHAARQQLVHLLPHSLTT
ncbi:MAG: hypothetical protein C0511_09375 [Hyphomicrobium sp.]|nr:hypothetical protein [Hyphomicrobium sp.]